MQPLDGGTGVTEKGGGRDGRGPGDADAGRRFAAGEMLRRRKRLPQVGSRSCPARARRKRVRSGPAPTASLRPMAV